MADIFEVILGSVEFSFVRPFLWQIFFHLALILPGISRIFPKNQSQMKGNLTGNGPQMKTQQNLSPLVKKTIVKLPKHIVRKLTIWIDHVEKFGLSQTQKAPGYHDEPLKGERFGQRSIRLNIAYRAIYVKKKGKEIEFLEVEEVSKHDY